MSVRRLAAIQPDSFAFSAASLKEVAVWIAKYPAGRQQSAVIPLLWLVQKQEGWISEPAIRAVAEMGCHTSSNPSNLRASRSASSTVA